jgi:hypothetical protein
LSGLRQSFLSTLNLQDDARTGIFTLTSFTTLNALLYPPYEKITRYNAIVIPYAEAVELPDQASWKFALGLSTGVAPLNTTKPVTMTKSKVQILTTPTPFENQ